MSTAAAVPSQQPPLSEVERLVDTFIAPSKTFTDLRRSSNWVVPFLLIALGIVALTFVAEKKLGFEKMVETQLAMQPKQAARLDQLSPQARAAQMETIVKFNKVFSYGSPVIVLVFLVIVAAVLLGTFNFGTGAELTFNQCIAVCMYASLTSVIKDVLGIIALLVGAGDNFTLQNPVASNLSGLIDPSSHFLYSAAMYADAFSIWTIALAGIGFSCLTRVKRGTCLAIVFGWWVLFILVMAGVAAAF